MTIGVGEFARANARIQRMPVNPLDRCTIVSVFPKVVDEFKPTISPGRFTIPAAADEDFSILVVGPSSWFKEMEEGQPYLEIPNSSIQIAESVIKDFANGLLGCNMGDRMPGLFFVPGAKSKQTILKENETDLQAARIKQKNWFLELVRIADILWARSNGNPLAISDDARMAAEKLQLKNKSWMGDFTQMELTNCPACGHMRNSNFPVCSNCKTIIDREKYKKLGLEQAS